MLARGRRIPFHQQKTAQEHMRRREVGVLLEHRLRADGGFGGSPREVQHPRDAELGLRAARLQGEHPLEGRARLVQRPLVEARLAEQEEQRDILRGNGDGLAEGVELRHRRAGSAGDCLAARCQPPAEICPGLSLPTPSDRWHVHCFGKREPLFPFSHDFPRC
jgi:hypothetical protein